MSWPLSLLVALLNALLAMVLAGFVASWSVDWYRISSIEGQSGFFVILCAFGGLLGGFVVGIVAARAAAAGANPGFVKGLAAAAGASVAILGTIAAINRALADVTPMWDGRTLMLHVELRWPATQREAPRVDGRKIVLGTLSGDQLRLSRPGPLWLADARREGDHWIAPGAVELYTTRGRRVLGIEPELPGATGLLLPLKGTPGREHGAWSEWMPHAKPGAAALPDGFRWRFRVVPRDEPVRTERIGAFEVDTIAESFREGGSDELDGIVADHARFVLRHRGRPVAFTAEAVPPPVVRAVATLPGEPPALLVLAGPEGGASSCHLLADDGGTLRHTRVSACTLPLQGEPLPAAGGSAATADDADARARAVLERPAHGRVDRALFMSPGLRLFPDAILDPATRDVRPLKIAGNQVFDLSVPPLALAPDGLSIVRLGYAPDHQERPALLVQDLRGGAPRHLVFDTRLTRYGGPDNIGPAWLAHYFEWRRDSDGRDRLHPSTGAAPLPWRGSLHDDSRGGLAYHLHPAGVALADALGAMLREEPGASIVPPHGGELPGTHKVKLGELTVNVFVDETNQRAALYLDEGGGDRAARTALVRRLAKRFDAQLATGRFDGLFQP